MTISVNAVHAPATIGDDMKEKTRKLKLFRIDPETVLAMLNWSDYSSIALPINNGLPEGATVHDVHYAFDRRCFVAIVEHESFKPVDIGVQLPYAEEWLDPERFIVDTHTYQKAVDMINTVNIECSFHEYGDE